MPSVPLQAETIPMSWLQQPSKPGVVAGPSTMACLLVSFCSCKAIMPFSSLECGSKPGSECCTTVFLGALTCWEAHYWRPCQSIRVYPESMSGPPPSMWPKLAVKAESKEGVQYCVDLPRLASPFYRL